jgi:hypothetical protein
MKRTLFTYKSAVGEFWIRPDAGGRVMLGLGRDQLKRFSSPRAAAIAVYEGSTGHAEWDDAADALRPKSLEQWKRARGLEKQEKKRRPDDDRHY